MDERDSVLVGNGESETRVRDNSEGLLDDDGDNTQIRDFDDQLGGGDDDVMVEVYGSDVFVDGVCSSGSRGNSEERELEPDRDGSVEVGLARDEVLIVDQVVEVDQEVIETRGSVYVESNSQIVDIVAGSVASSVEETGTGKYSEAVVASAHEEPRVVSVSQVAALSNENSTDGQMVQNEALQHNESLDNECSVHNDRIHGEAGSVDDESGKSGIESGTMPITITVEEILTVEPPVEEHMNPDDEIPADVSEDIESSSRLTQIIGNKNSKVYDNVIVESKNDTLRDDNVNEGPVSSGTNQNFLDKNASEQTVESIVHKDSEVREEVAAVEVIAALNGAQGPEIDGLETIKDGGKVKSGTNSTTEHLSNADCSNTNAVNSVSSYDEGLYKECHGQATDEAVADMDHHVSGLDACDNRFEDTMDEFYEVEDPHHEGSGLPMLVDTFGFPAPECLGNSITKLGSDLEEEDMHDAQTVEPEVKDIAKVPKVIVEERKAAHQSNTASANPRQSYKIGDCISRVASRLTGSPLIRKINTDSFQKADPGNQRSAGSGYEASFQTTEDPPEGNLIAPGENLSPDKMLPSLHLIAQDPSIEFTLRNTVISFFSDFRDSVVPGRYSARGSASVEKVANGRKRKATHAIGSPKTFEFEDMKDSYWTDRVIQNGSEEQPSRKNKREYHQSRAFQPVNLQATQGLQSRKKTDDRNSSGHRFAAGRSITSTDMKDPMKDTHSTPTEVVMKFPSADSVPSEKELTLIFRYFGPLKEAETEVDLQTSRARVIFRRCLDAEVAFDSASTFNIWGQVPVSYELNYSPSEPFKAPPAVPSHELEAAIAQDMEMAAAEYLDDANTHYLDGVSIQYLEDETTQYMEDAPVHYTENGSMQYAEVPLTQPQEHGKNEAVVDASPHIVGVATTEDPEATSTHGLKESLSENPQIAETQQNLEDAATHKLKSLPSQNLEAVETDQIPENTVPQGEKSSNPGVEMPDVGVVASAPHNLDNETTENHRDATTLAIKAAGAQALDDIMDGEVQIAEVLVPQHSYETPEYPESAGVQVLDDITDGEVQIAEVSVPQHSSETPEYPEAAGAQAVDDVTDDEVHIAEVSVPQHSYETPEYSEAAGAQAVDDVTDGEVQNAEVSVPQHSYEPLEYPEAAAAYAIDGSGQGEVHEVEITTTTHTLDISTTVTQHATAVEYTDGEVHEVEVTTTTHTLDISTTDKQYATAVEYTDGDDVTTHPVEETDQQAIVDAAEHHSEDEDTMTHPQVDMECDGNDVTTQGVEAELQTIDDTEEHDMDDMECDDAMKP